MAKVKVEVKVTVKNCEASRHRPSMSGVAQTIHIKLSENVFDYL